jgi:fructokinase
MSNSQKHEVVCFGEILWDVLPNGAKPGGAPMNVAYHLRKLGINPALITRIGNDQWGRDLLSLMNEQKISTDFFQTDESLATGVVNATINANNEVTYDIVKPVAWDNIMWQNGMGTLISEADYFVFGSLSSRSEVSRNTLFQLIEKAKYRVLDINLRAPHYSKESIEQLLTKANLLKLNHEELKLIGGWYTTNSSDNELIKAILDKYSLDKVVVTKGADGAILFCDGVFYSYPGIKITVADTVGSGDSFLAALLHGFINNNKPEQVLQFACAVGALVATYTGACPDYDPEEINQLQFETV